MKDQSTFKTSTGDEAATKSQGMGVVTHTIQGELSFASWSMDVKFEGANVDRHLDMTLQNEQCQPDNTPPWIYQDAAATQPIPVKECEGEVNRAKAACENSGHITREQQCADEKCSKAKKCLLVSYRQGARKGQSSTVGCCGKETPHHLVEAHGLCEQGDRGVPLPEFNVNKPPHQQPYDERGAPCVCAKGSRWTKEHGAFHALVGQKENAAVALAKATGADDQKAWNYGQAKQEGVSAHQKIFPDSGCTDGCLKKQLDTYHNSVGASDETPLRTGTQGLQEWQKQSAADVIQEMQDQLGGFASAAA